MNTGKLTVFALFTLLATIVLTACGGAPRAPSGAFESSQPLAAPTSAPAAPLPAAATAAPADAKSADANTNGSVANASPSTQVRMIIKNGEMSLLVEDTDRALEKVTDAAVNSGGYVVSSRTDFKDGFKTARVTMGVPVQQFEAVQHQLRSISIQVLSDVASGQDVSDEYVDLQARLNNQQATAARIREFLKDAKTVEEALKVNDQLSQVENEIEKIKGRMQFLTDRSAFSTIVVDLSPVRPTPTPTPTATPTATPTPTFWQPDKTVEKASDTLGGLLRMAGDTIIWVVIVLGPCLVPLVLIVLLIAYLRRRARARKPAVPAAIDTKPVEGKSEVKDQKPDAGGKTG